MQQHLRRIDQDRIAIATAAAIGLSSTPNDAWFRSQGIPLTHDVLEARFEDPVVAWSAHIARSTTIRVTRHRRCFVEQCRYLPLSAWVLKAPARFKVPPDAYLLAMFIDRADQLGTAVHIDYDHVDGAFAYARFYLRGATAFVIEIQSDAFGQIVTPSAKHRLSHWSRQLLLAFQEFIRRTQPAIKRVAIAPADYQLRRYPDLNPRLADRVYTQLPIYLGYQLCDDIDLRFEPVHQPKLIRSAWVRRLDADAPDELEQQFGSVFAIAKHNRYITALDSYNEHNQL